jgi:hypothetical protein
MGEEPEVIRHQIEETRDEMGRTADALAWKADVPSRAKEAIGEKAGALKEKVTGAAHRASENAPDGQQVAQAGRKAVGVAQENPLGLALGAFAVGVIAGMLIPETRMEHERMGPVADQVKEAARDVAGEALERGKDVGQSALEHGKEVARETAEAVQQEAKSSGQSLAESARERARVASEEISSTD